MPIPRSPLSRSARSFPSPSIRESASAMHCRVNAVIAKYFEKLLTTTASRDVSHAQLVAGEPSYTRPWYTSSLIRRTPDAAHHDAIAASSSGGITVPVGLAGLATITPA